MFSLGATVGHPQLYFLPLTQASSLLNSVRQTANQGLAAARQCRTQCSTASVDESLSSSDINEAFQAIAAELDLLALREDLYVEQASASQLSPATSHWTQSQVSAHTFFENKYGFPESQLWNRLFQQPNPPVFMLQQRRGFKTKDSKGFGVTEKARHAESLGSIGVQRQPADLTAEGIMAKWRNTLKSWDRNSAYKKASQLNPLQKLTDQESSPETKENLKVAFSEGYMAGAGGSQKKDRIFKPLRILGWFVVLGAAYWAVLFAASAYSKPGNMSGDRRGGNPGGFGARLGLLGSQQYEVNPSESKTTFQDVKGADEAQEELQDIVEFLRDPDRYTCLGARLPKGVLLVGIPGVGKTLLARAVAGEAGVPFFQASGSEFDELFVGYGAKKIRDLFDSAKSRAPCVVFIDEIDSVGQRRTTSTLHPYANQTINQLLSEMDGFVHTEGIIVLAATNKKENLDPALLRPGRFDVEVTVDPPDMKGRKQILELYLSQVKHASDVDITALARGTIGMTGADLANLVNQASLKAGKDKQKKVTQAHLEFAREKILIGPAKKNKIPDEEARELIAYHEAGHALCAYYNKKCPPVHKISILPRSGGTLGYTLLQEVQDQHAESKSKYWAHLEHCLGGRAAEELVYGTEGITGGAADDLKQATALASMMVRSCGMSEKVGLRYIPDSQKHGSVADEEITRILQEAYERSLATLKTHRKELKMLADALLKYEALEANELKLVLEGKELKRDGPNSNAPPGQSGRKLWPSFEVR